MAKKTHIKTPAAAKPRPVEIKQHIVDVPQKPVSLPNPDALPFGRSNFIVMLIGLSVILIGFFVMTLDKEEFGFGFLGITLGPILVFCGFMIELFAILKKKA